MKKLLPLYMAVLCFLSCSKNIVNEHQGYQTTGNLNLKTDNTGVTLGSAQKLAILFLSSKNPNIDVKIKNALTIEKNGIPYFHVINTNAGFAILSSDSLYKPIIAFDSVNNFSLEAKDINVGIALWMNKHAHQLETVRKTGNPIIDSIGNENRMLWRAVGNSLVNGSKQQNLSTTSTNGHAGVQMLPPTLISSVPINYSTNSTVGPLCSTLFDQTYPWNQDCPIDPKENGTPYVGIDPAGCVPVAMAQVMYFWHFPTSYNWTSMAKSVNLSIPAQNYYTTPGAFTESARLISNIGTTPGDFWTSVLHSLKSSKFAYYSNAGTSCDMEYCATIFNTFGYSSATTSEGIADQVASGPRDGVPYLGLITNEIQNYRRPCLVGGNNSENNEVLFYLPSSDGHTWVCDGSNVTWYYSGTQNTYKSSTGVITVQTSVSNYYTSYFLHMNWGLGGIDNAWYDATIDYSNVPSLHEDFKYFQLVTSSIHP
jgi:Peptidase C10 family/Spi protease inhibitor